MRSLMEYCASALEAIGRTPLVRVRRVTDSGRATVLAKLEFLNPGASSKDRIALAMIEHAERAGLLRRRERPDTRSG
jgi:cystathionine beta-synthase